ncbi:RING finger protein 151-like [Ylistrum balloti]|uniref:RING finger protein 151-like n=1 Tax=Ylistrum balloti TaxID=509963 RepID=UPI002905A4E1|nr:RING finger protein 151-like [Ylistrum balloti]
MSWKRKHPEPASIETEEERYFLNPDSVSSHLYCSICQDVFSDPQRAPCGHSFCKKCILPWLKHSKTCPEDRKTLHIGQLHHDFILENIIGDQMVACPFRRSGCEFIGQLQRLNSHKKSCDFNPKNLPEFIKKNTPVENAAEKSIGITSDLEVIPSPGKPSLMMRLFRAGDDQKKLLGTMFEDKENKM